MNKKRVLVIALVCVLLLSGVAGWKNISDYSRIMENNWGISLPWKSLYKEIYEKDAGASFHGDGVRYHVFSYKYEDDIDLMFAWSPVERKTLFYSTVSEAAERWLDEIEVPAEERPTYSQCASWHKSKEDNSEIIFFWDSDFNRLYIVENFL